jgi:hypothetical protein
MSLVAHRLSLGILLLMALALPTALSAQNTSSEPVPEPRKPREHRATSPQPIVFSFVLRQAGQVVINPFATSGRREVLQLMAGGSPLRGQFRRARLDRLGEENWSIEGWYEIRGNVIQLYHRDATGNATGRVEIGRYLENTICLDDPESEYPLAFIFLKPVTANTLDRNQGQEDSIAANDTLPADDDASDGRCGVHADATGT